MKTTSAEGKQGRGVGREKVTARTQRRSLHDWSVGGKRCTGVGCTDGTVRGGGGGAGAGGGGGESCSVTATPPDWIPQRYSMCMYP